MLTIVTKSTKGSAIFDVSHRYRYLLTRSWTSPDTHNKQIAFIMLNPSQGNAEQDDPTIRACSQFARVWKYTQLNVVNLFAYRATNSSELKAAANPIGVNNDNYLLTTTESADKVILAWGNSGSFLGRDKAVVKLLFPQANKLYYLKLNRSGQPSHPLYVKRTIKLKPWQTLLPTNN